MSDNREWRRLGVEVEVDYQSDHNFYTGFTYNIGAGGLFIATDDPLEVGAVLSVELKLPEESTVVSMAIVRWVRGLELGGDMPSGMGVQFTDLRLEDREKIERFVETRPTIFHPDID